MLVSGAVLTGFRQGCINLGFLTDEELAGILEGVVPSEWYPLEYLERLESAVKNAYRNPDNVFMRIGQENMFIWYEHGPGAGTVKRGSDFLELQRDSAGYFSMVKGEPGIIGRFALESHDAAAGRAVIVSTTPFNKAMEEGTIYGGMRAPGDLSLVRINREGSIFYIDYE